MSTTEQIDARKHTTIRLAKDLAERLEEVRESEGRSQTWVVERALREYFGKQQESRA